MSDHTTGRPFSWGHSPSTRKSKRYSAVIVKYLETCEGRKASCSEVKLHTNVPYPAKVAVSAAQRGELFTWVDTSGSNPIRYIGLENPDDDDREKSGEGEEGSGAAE